MITFFLTFGLLVFIILIMSIGILFADKELKGSCGGVSKSCDCTTIQKKICSFKSNITS